MILRPNWLCSPFPQANTMPVLVKARKWSSPHATWTMVCLSTLRSACGTSCVLDEPALPSKPSRPSAACKLAANKSQGVSQFASLVLGRQRIGRDKKGGGGDANKRGETKKAKLTRKEPHARSSPRSLMASETLSPAATRTARNGSPPASRCSTCIGVASSSSDVTPGLLVTRPSAALSLILLVAMHSRVSSAKRGGRPKDGQEETLRRLTPRTRLFLVRRWPKCASRRRRGRLHPLPTPTRAA